MIHIIGTALLHLFITSIIAALGFVGGCFFASTRNGDDE